MRGDRAGVALALGAALCFVGAGLEARGLSRRPVPPPTHEEAAVVEASFRDVGSARGAGRAEEALLALRHRAEKGPYPGYAWFLLGELAWEERVLGTAVRNYRKAVELDAGVTDRTAAFASGRTLGERVRWLARSGWPESRPLELADFRYLQRRLSGGCE